MRHLKTFENRKNDMELIQTILDIFIECGAYKTQDYYKMNTKAGEALFTFYMNIRNEFHLSIMFEDKIKAKKLLINCDDNGWIKIETYDDMLFVEETLKLLKIIGLSELERTLIKYNIQNNSDR